MYIHRDILIYKYVDLCIYVSKSRDLVINCDVEEEMVEEKESVTRTRMNRTDSVSSLVSVSSCASGASVGSGTYDCIQMHITYVYIYTCMYIHIWISGFFIRYIYTHLDTMCKCIYA
jgi:hypothetical protein